MDKATPSTVTMRKREEPRFCKFETGDVVEGVLIKVKKLRVEKDGRISFVNLYTVAEGEGRFAKFLGTYQIDDTLYPSDLGHKVDVRCVGKDVTKTKNGNAMKIFDIFVSDELVQPGALAIPQQNDVENVDPSMITDADIPF